MSIAVGAWESETGLHILLFVQPSPKQFSASVAFSSHAPMQAHLTKSQQQSAHACTHCRLYALHCKPCRGSRPVGCARMYVYGTLAHTRCSVQEAMTTEASRPTTGAGASCTLRHNTAGTQSSSVCICRLHLVPQLIRAWRWGEGGG
jgi:hypothetical protein